MAAMFACPNSKKAFRRSVSHPVLIRIFKSKHAAIAGKVEISSIGTQSHSTFFCRAEERLGVGSAIAIGIVQFLDVSLAGDDDVSRCIERHRINVVCQIRPGIN